MYIGFFALFCLAHASGYCDIVFRTSHTSIEMGMRVDTPYCTKQRRFAMKHLIGTTLVVIAGFGTAVAYAQEGSDQATIRKAIQSYVAAFNGRDAQALAAHWSPEGVYISRLDGGAISGRDALEQEFAAQFEEANNTMVEVTTESINFISPNVALEQGTAMLITPDAKPTNSSYSVVHVKRDGKWLIDRVSEEVVVEPASHYEQLKDLEWTRPSSTSSSRISLVGPRALGSMCSYRARR